MPDGPTVGGYLRVAVVATTDLGRVAQRTPGESVRFRMIEVHEARARLRSQEEVLSRLARSARTLPIKPGPDHADTDPHA